MRFYILASIICVLIPGAAFAQYGWERTYGGTGDDYGSSVQHGGKGTLPWF
jgi:hypothetical protein